MPHPRPGRDCRAGTAPGPGPAAGLEDAEDVAQNVLRRLLAAGPGFSPDAGVKRWVYRVTMNRCRDHLRTRRRRVGAVPATKAPPDPALVVEPAAERQLDLAAVRQAMGPAMEGLGFADVDRLTETPQGTVASRVLRAQKQVGAIREAAGAWPRGRPVP